MPGIQPFGIVAFLLQLGGEDGGGKKFAKGYLLILWRCCKLAEKLVHLLLNLGALLPREKALHYGLMAISHAVYGLFGAVKKGVRAAAYGAAHKHYGAFAGFGLNNIQDPGHCRCVCYRRSAEFKYPVTHRRLENS